MFFIYICTYYTYSNCYRMKTADQLRKEIEAAKKEVAKDKKTLSDLKAKSKAQKK